jgi:hypothetical protein
MLFITNAESDEKELQTGITDLDARPLNLTFMDGYGATDIAIGESGGITWKQLDELKKAIALAEKEWR